MESGPPGDLNHLLPSVQVQRSRANGHPGASQRWWGSPELRMLSYTRGKHNLCHIHRSGRVTGTLMYEETKPTLRNPTMQNQATFVFRCLRGRTEFGVKPGKIWLETSHYGPDGNSTSLVPTNAQNLLWLWPSAPGVLRSPGWHYMAGLGEIPWVPQIVLALSKTVAVWMAHGERVLYSRQWCPAEETNWSGLLQRLRDAGPWSSADFHLWGGSQEMFSLSETLVKNT